MALNISQEIMQGISTIVMANPMMGSENNFVEYTCNAPSCNTPPHNALHPPTPLLSLIIVPVLLIAPVLLLHKQDKQHHHLPLLMYQGKIYAVNIDNNLPRKGML